MIHWVGLNMIEGMKPIHRSALIKEFATAENVFRLTEMELSAVPEIKPDLAYRIAHFPIKTAEEEYRRVQQYGITILSLDSSEYPSLLRTIPDPPLVLYIKGSLLANEITVALVGSRKATPYGLNVTHILARDLGQAGVTIVSGLARGIDAKAHVSTLDAGARTIAVLGSGVDVIYPSEHRVIAQRIVDQGALISEFPLGTSPNRENFPIRNRIISGLSRAVVVVEASDKSGSLITARMAMEQGREVLAVPGSVFNESSRGCHALIKDGAALVRNWKDVAAELPEYLIVPADSHKSVAAELTDAEKSVVDLLSFEEPTHVDQIAGLARVQSAELLSTLVSLELKNYITQLPGKHFLRLK